MEKTSYAKAQSNLMMPIQKSSRSTCFFCLPQKVPAMLSQEKIGGTTNWFLKQNARHEYDMTR
jgi:hypothetical protein